MKRNIARYMILMQVWFPFFKCKQGVFFNSQVKIEMQLSDTNATFKWLYWFELLTWISSKKFIVNEKLEENLTVIVFSYDA